MECVVVVQPLGNKIRFVRPALLVCVTRVLYFLHQQHHYCKMDNHNVHTAFDKIHPDRAKPLAMIVSTNHNEQYFKWVASQSTIVEAIQAVLTEIPRNSSLFQLFSYLVCNYHTLHIQHHQSWERCATIVMIGRMIGMMTERVVAEATHTSHGRGRKTTVFKRLSDHTGLTEVQIKAVMRCDRFFSKLEGTGESAGFGKNSFGIFVFFDPRNSSK